MKRRPQAPSELVVKWGVVLLAAPFFANTGRKPCAMIANPKADAVRAQLDHWRRIAGLDQVTAVLLGDAESLDPFLEIHHPVEFASDAYEFAPLAKGIDGIGAQAGLRYCICKSHDDVTYNYAASNLRPNLLCGGSFFGLKMRVS
jgi:hypothetical protein